MQKRDHPVAGTPDVIEAGKRIIFWCVAATYPSAVQRQNDHNYLFHHWTGRLLEILSNEVRASRCVMDAVKSAFESSKTSNATTIEPGDSLFQHSLAPLIIRLDDQAYLLRHFGEVGFCRDKTAERVTRIIMERKVSVPDLIGRKKSDRKTISLSDDGIQVTMHQSEFKSDPEGSRLYLKKLPRISHWKNKRNGRFLRK